MQKGPSEEVGKQKLLLHVNKTLGEHKPQLQSNNPLEHISKPAHISAIYQTGVIVFVLGILKRGFFFFLDQGHLALKKRAHDLVPPDV